MTSKSPYKTLFVGVLVQKTGLSIGGNQPHQRVDAPLCRDGAGRLVLRGSGLAGALLATARTLYNTLPTTISAGSPQQQRAAQAAADDEGRLEESLWRVFNSHPLQPDGTFGCPQTEYRTGVGILQRTGAAAEGAKFDSETLPVGTRWWFCLEVDDYREMSSPGRSAAIAANALTQWQAGCCWLGRDVARGLGWLMLSDLRVYSLSVEHIGLWPQSDQEPWQVINQLPDALRLDHKDLQDVMNHQPPDREPIFLAGRGRIRVGLDAFDPEASYGIDTLSVGGADIMRHQQNWSAHYLKAEGLQAEAAVAEFDPDHVLAWTKTSQGDVWPYIPGSSLRGPWRHALAWWLRSRQAATIWDPNSKAAITQDAVAALFGTTETSAALLISDAHLCDTDYQVALLELHAEDEFTAGAYESAKFNRLCLLKGQFEFEFRVEATDEEKLREFAALLHLLNQLGRQSLIPLGAGKWRGHGWVQWDLHYRQGNCSE